MVTFLVCFLSQCLITGRHKEELSLEYLFVNMNYTQSQPLPQPQSPTQPTPADPPAKNEIHITLSFKIVLPTTHHILSHDRISGLQQNEKIKKVRGLNLNATRFLIL